MLVKKNKWVIVAIPLILGILALVAIIVYLYSANHAPYKYTDIILAVPICSLIGIIISFITRKSRKEYLGLWISGMILCASLCVFCLTILLLLYAIFI